MSAARPRRIFRRTTNSPTVAPNESAAAPQPAVAGATASEMPVGIHEESTAAEAQIMNIVINDRSRSRVDASVGDEPNSRCRVDTATDASMAKGKGTHTMGIHLHRGSSATSIPMIAMATTTSDDI